MQKIRQLSTVVFVHAIYHGIGGGWSLPPERRYYVEYKLIIPGRLDGLNKFIGANRSNSCAGNNMKKRNEKAVRKAIGVCLYGVKIENPVYMEYIWYEKDMRRDPDNISSFGRKVIQDALVNAAILKGDGWKYVVGFSDRFEVDKENPRIEIIIKEI